MFTGLVEATGTVQQLSITPGGDAKLTLLIPFAPELSLGESVAVNGCCLTVAEIHHDNQITFALLGSTLKVTSLGALQENDLVNLERALAVGDRLGGHFVQGHVDATGSIIAITPQGPDYTLEIALPPSIHNLCIDKGSFGSPHTLSKPPTYNRHLLTKS